MTRRWFRFLGGLGLVAFQGRGLSGLPLTGPTYLATQILVREDLSVEVTALNIAKDQLAGILDAAMIPEQQRGALAQALARAPNLTITFTSRRCV